MENRYQFRQVTAREIPVVFDLIQRRVAWMDRVGIRQWNVTHYAAEYPLEYYEKRRQQGELFCLEEMATGRILCVGALLRQDARWQTGEDALYLHHFASEPEAKGAGSIFLQAAENYVRQQGKSYLRLDSAVGNAVLENYYASRGYAEAGVCVDKLYQGVLRQKKLF